MTGTRVRSQFLVFLMFTSTMLALVGPASSVSAENETTSGTITGTETWSGSHELTGDLTIAAGAKLIINPGTEISLPNGPLLMSEAIYALAFLLVAQVVMPQRLIQSPLLGMLHL